TRFLTAFYGQWPAPEVPVTGDCEVRKGVFEQTGIILGNRVWLDKNKNGIQDIDEPGIGGVCVNLYGESGDVIDQTTTDSNGYYGFNAEAGKSYVVEFVKPENIDFTQPDIGDENHDSDADPSSGKTQAVALNQDNLLLDAGLIPNDALTASLSDVKLQPQAQIGPVRSGRLLYGYLANLFHDSCLVYAFASQEVLEKIPHCSFVTHETSGGGSMLEIDRMKAIAEDNMRHTADKPFNYTSNVYSDEAPAGGVPASQINVFFASLNQSAWTYDPLYHAWLRSVDNADKNQRGVLHYDVDRLTGRQLHFENVIVLMADTDVVSPTNLDIHLDAGNDGYAFLFRDGQMYKIRWNTRAGDYEKKTGFERPIKFVNMDGSPVALKPGHTWVIIVTPFSIFQEQETGAYLVRYTAPEGESR
ncbi:MAG TPA: SdrD B-like domain-containing protein, partial [Anaerolineales bacterium]|nr:SdrD B-like domain-containing protein [Anaerolineales bacterium]